MKKLTMKVLREINEVYEFNYSEEILKDVYNELTLTKVVTMNDIMDEFENIN